MRLCGTDFLKEKAAMLAYRCLITLLILCGLLNTGAAQTKIPPPAVSALLAPPGTEDPIWPAYDTYQQATQAEIEERNIAPHYILVIAPAEAKALPESLALARLCSATVQIILLVERPVSVGACVGARGQEGTATRIPIRATTIQNPDNQTVLTPHKASMAGHVTNRKMGDMYVRVIVPVGVQYGSDWEAWLFVPSPCERFVIANDLLLRIDAVFQEHAVYILFPQRAWHLRSADADLELCAPGNGRPLAEVAKVQTTIAPARARHPAREEQTEPLGRLWLRVCSA
jgi:hypothetical protein